jgi:HAD superfamily hydrolase (TIGR01549 family)
MESGRSGKRDPGDAEAPWLSNPTTARDEVLHLNAGSREDGDEFGQSTDGVRETIGAIYDRYDEDALRRWTLREGSKDLLSVLKTKGMKTGLVSNVGRKILEKALLKLDLRPFFNVVVSRNNVQYMKPSGEGLILALTQLQVMKDKALYVGDSMDDIQAAKATGVKVILIVCKENPKAELLSTGPHQLIYHFNELLTSLRRVNL